jgi:hypothetical protein
MEYDNPAARLLSILEEGKNIPSNTFCRSAWEQILKTNGNAPLLMSRLGKVMELPQETIQAIKDSFPAKQAIWTHWNSQVTSAFTKQNLQGDWNSFFHYIDSHTITYLQMSAELLEGKSTTKSIGDEKISELRNELEGIYKETLDAPINEDVKKYLIRYLRKLLTSLDEYRLTGALPVLEAVEIMLGHAHIEPEYGNFLTKTELGKTLLTTLASTANVVTVAVGIPQLAPVVGSLLQLAG